MTERVRRLTIAGGLALFALASPWGTALAADKVVTMYANEYRPGVVTINVGDTVTWVNDDDVSHDAVGNGWSTSLLGYQQSDAVRFRRAGRFPYTCSIHPQMRSAVIVRGATAGATVPPTDTTVTSSDQTDPPWSWVTVPLVLLAGSALLLVLVWPRRGRSEA